MSRGKTAATYEINYMDGDVHSHSKPGELKEREIAFCRNIWSLLKEKKFRAAERVHLRAQGIPAMFASCRCAVTDTKGHTATRGGCWSDPRHDRLDSIFEDPGVQRSPCACSVKLFYPSQPCYGPDSGLVLPQWDSSCGCGLRSWSSPSSHPTEIPKLKRPKGDINSWHPRVGKLM